MRSSCVSFAAKAAPVAIAKPAPTMPLAPRMPLEKSATCMEPPMPLQMPVRFPQIAALAQEVSVAAMGARDPVALAKLCTHSGRDGLLSDIKMHGARQVPGRCI